MAKKMGGLMSVLGVISKDDSIPLEKMSEFDKKYKGGISHLSDFDFTNVRHNIRGITSKELLEKNFQDPLWIVEDVIPEGLTILVGKPKTGKSWISLQLASCVAVGGIFLDKYSVDQHGVLYLALEDTERRLKKRVELIGALPTEDLMFFTNFNRGKAGEKTLDDHLTHNPKIKLIIIDTIGQFFQSFDYNDYNSVKEIMKPLKDLSSKHTVSIIAVTHAKKGREGDFLDNVLGSSAFAGGADTIIELIKGRGRADGYLKSTGRDIDENEIGLELVRDHGWRFLGDGSECRLENTRKAIYETLRDANEILSAPDINAMIGGHYGNTKTTLCRMVKDGQIRRKNRGCYEAL
jgi:hypothetical protein